MLENWWFLMCFNGDIFVFKLLRVSFLSRQFIIIDYLIKKKEPHILAKIIEKLIDKCPQRCTRVNQGEKVYKKQSIVLFKGSLYRIQSIFTFQSLILIASKWFSTWRFLKRCYLTPWDHECII